MADWRVPGFVELRELGAGAQGRAVLVRQSESGWQAVLKYVCGEVDPAGRERFRRESTLLKRVDSRYVARWYGHFEAPAGSAILMEAVDGISLRQVLAEHGALGPEASLVVLKGSLLGLAAAHEVGVVHRDYKPANVVVEQDGGSKLIDFGIATLSGGDGSRSGTPAYMAPEQWRAEPATPATDVYAATCVFFECVTGDRPYEAEGTTALMAKHLSAPVPIDQVPEPLRPLVATGMAKSPTDRPAGAADFVTELEAAAVAAYGPDWEARGLRGLVAAAAALAALLPLASIAPGGAAIGGVAGHAAGTVIRSVVRKALAANAGTKTTVAVIAVVITIAATGAYVVRQRHHPATPPRRPAAAVRPVTFDLKRESRRVADVALRVDKAQYVGISGHRDPAIQQKINKALHQPIDDAVTRWRAEWKRAAGGIQKAIRENNFRPTLTVKAQIVLRGPRLLSVRYIVDTPAFAGGGDDVYGRAVNVDLTTGRTLANSDIFRPATLTDDGMRALARRVPAPTPTRSAGCIYPSLVEMRSAYGGYFASAAVNLAADHLEFTWKSFEECQDTMIVKVPYTKIFDLLRPSLTALIHPS